MTTSTTTGLHMPDLDPDENLTVAQVAQELGVRQETIRRWLVEGAFPKAWRHSSKRAVWHIPRRAVTEWLSRRDQQSGQ